MNETLRYLCFFAEINKKIELLSCCEKEWRSFFFIILFNERLNEEITSTVSESSLHFVKSWLKERLFFLVERITLCMCVCRGKRMHFPLEVMFQCHFFQLTEETISSLCATVTSPVSLIEMLRWKCTTGSFAKFLFVFHSPGQQSSAVWKTNNPQIYDNK